MVGRPGNEASISYWFKILPSGYKRNYQIWLWFSSCVTAILEYLHMLLSSSKPLYCHFCYQTFCLSIVSECGSFVWVVFKSKPHSKMLPRVQCWFHQQFISFTIIVDFMTRVSRPGSCLLQRWFTKLILLRMRWSVAERKPENKTLDCTIVVIEKQCND